jgi:hypothetical protein
MAAIYLFSFLFLKIKFGSSFWSHFGSVNYSNKLWAKMTTTEEWKNSTNTLWAESSQFLRHSHVCCFVPQICYVASVGVIATWMSRMNEPWSLEWRCDTDTWAVVNEVDWVSPLYTQLQGMTLHGGCGKSKIGGSVHDFGFHQRLNLFRVSSKVKWFQPLKSCGDTVVLPNKFVN